MTQVSYEMQARQQTNLTPRQQQSVKLLQMSTLDFNQEIARAIATNPFLEESDESSIADKPVESGGSHESSNNLEAIDTAAAGSNPDTDTPQASTEPQIDLACRSIQLPLK